MNIFNRNGKMFVNEKIAFNRRFIFEIESERDFLDFITNFGKENFELYPKLRKLKENGELTWKDIRNIKADEIANIDNMKFFRHVKNRVANNDIQYSIVKFQKSMQKDFMGFISDCIKDYHNKNDVIIRKLQVKAIIELKVNMNVDPFIQKNEIVALVFGNSEYQKNIQDILKVFNIAPDQHLKAERWILKEYQMDYFKDVFSSEFDNKRIIENKYYKATRIDKCIEERVKKIKERHKKTLESRKSKLDIAR